MTAKSTGVRCGRPAIGPHSKCDIHGGKSTGPVDVTPLEGNDHAVGNLGGGAPELNTNAEIHGVFGELDTIEERLSDADREWVDELTACYLDRADDGVEDVEKKAREAALIQVKLARANVDFFRRGPAWSADRSVSTPDDEAATSRTVVNPTWRESVRLSRRCRELEKELGVFPR